MTEPEAVVPAALDESTVDADPVLQLQAWLNDAEHAGISEPSAMTLATTTRDGQPSARIVLLRGLDARGLAFYSNYESRKARELAADPRAAIVFYWRALARQVRVEGIVERLTGAESDAYFLSRPRGHRLSAWASQQSSVIPSRAFLEERLREADARFGPDVPRPPYWGGYRVVPERFEFWQGRPDRMHDRIAYRRDEHGWRTVRLAP